MENNITTLPPIIRMSDTYKLIVPQEVEYKIRYLIRKFPHNEWSGILFITHTGSFEKHDLVITCKDIFPMASGSSGWTEFTMNEDVAAYMAQKMELFDCDTALIHSHHSMSAQFSGQDIRTLQDQGNDKNCFVSLIVNTRGKYQAAITRKVHFRKTITTKVLDGGYEFFGDGKVTLTKGSKSTKEVDDTVIEYFMLDVERHEVENPLAYLDERFAEIEAKSAQQPSNSPFTRGFNANKEGESWLEEIRSKYPNIVPSAKEAAQYRQQQSQPLDLFDDNDMPPAPKTVDESNMLPFEKLYQEAVVDEAALKTAVTRLLCCSFIVNPDKVDLKQWVTRNMERVYKALFENKKEDIDGHLEGSFEDYADAMIEWTINHFPMVEYPATFNPDQYDWEYIESAIVAQSIEDEICSYGNNEYIHYYCKTLDRYINTVIL